MSLICYFLLFSSHLELTCCSGAFIFSGSINFLPASRDFSCLLVFFATSLDPDQDRHIVGPDLDQNCLTH